MRVCDEEVITDNRSLAVNLTPPMPACTSDDGNRNDNVQVMYLLTMRHNTWLVYIAKNTVSVTRPYVCGNFAQNRLLPTPPLYRSRYCYTPLNWYHCTAYFIGNLVHLIRSECAHWNSRDLNDETIIPNK